MAMSVRHKVLGGQGEGDFVKRLPYLTLALIIISVAVALHSSFGSAEDALKALFFASPGHTGLEEIESG